MPLTDVDVVRRRYSVKLPIDLVHFNVYSYNEYIFEEKHFKSVHDIINLLEKDTKNEKSYWIEVINDSSVNLPNNIKYLCEYFDMHPLTIEDISTLATCMKLDLFYDQQPSIYILLKIISWNGQRVEQQQISFYLKSSKNILITFQEKSINNQSYFNLIRNHLRSNNQSPYQSHNRIKHMNIDYLFYCLFDAIIDQYMIVIEEIASRIDQFDEKFMKDKKSLTLESFHLIYRLKHDLLHLRILFNPLKEMICRLERTTQDIRFFLHSHSESLTRLGFNHHIVRRQINNFHLLTPNNSESLLTTTNSIREPRRTSMFLSHNIYIYLRDLNDHINLLVDSVEIQRENVSNLVSLWLTLSDNETQKILKILMLISAFFMPGVLLIGINSTNFNVQPQYQYKYSYYIILSLLSGICISMITWYKLKRWI